MEQTVLIDKKRSTMLQNEQKSRYHNILITLIALTVMPVYLYGLRVVNLLLLSLVSSFLLDYICIRISGKKGHEKYDYSYAVTAIITVLLMPATVPYFVVVVSVLISICVAKHPFGGNGKTVFNPTAVGVAFCTICWPQYLLRYPAPFSTINVKDFSLIQYAPSLASVLRVGGIPKIDYFNIFLGKFAGPMGATCMIVLGCCLFYLLTRKAISFRIVFSTFVVAILFALIFPRIDGTIKQSLVFEFASSSFVFGVIFMASEPSSMPKTHQGQWLYGFLLGTIIMLFRHFGQIELEFVYAILLANVFAIPCDRYASYLNKKYNKLVKNKVKSDKKVGEVNA